VRARHIIVLVSQVERFICAHPGEDDGGMVALGLKQYRIKNAMVVVQAAGGVGVGEWTSRDLQRQTPA
jgi:hypothetical protein